MKEQKEQLEEKNTEMSSIITRYEEFVQKNKKYLIAGGSIIAVAVIIFCVFKFYINPKQDKAAAADIFYAENYFDQAIDSIYYGNVEAGNAYLQKSLSGEGKAHGFLAVIDEYGSTKAGNLAKYYAGIANLRLGNYDEASKWLGKYSGKDTFTKPIAIMAQGDAEMEKGNTEAAVKQYLSAAKADDNAITAPAALFKAGMGYLMLGDNEKALDCFKQIKRNYPESTEWSDIDKYIGLVENVK